MKEKASKKQDNMFLIFHFVAAVKTTSNLKTRGLESLAYFLQPPKQRINRAEFKFIAATLPAKVNIMILLKAPLNELMLLLLSTHIVQDHSNI